MTLLPGLVDAHAHVAGTEDLRQALRFGVTTVLDMAAIGPLPLGMAAIRAKSEASFDLADVRSAFLPATSPGSMYVPALACWWVRRRLLSARIRELTLQAACAV